jgi:hypothetical protein
MTHKKKPGWLWLTLIVGGFTALALGATFAPGILNQRIAEGPATWGLVANALFIVFIIGIMGLAIRPFSRSDNRTDR